MEGNSVKEYMSVNVESRSGRENMEKGSEIVILGLRA